MGRLGGCRGRLGRCCGAPRVPVGALGICHAYVKVNLDGSDKMIPLRLNLVAKTPEKG